ncbi:hypothetical protein ACFYXS_19060 [Streptomyces sp. NPDC002574]|uniref:hypothetical protein n=1 Tax=Streptomyces sp. NPDC002574 TaxID=3364652 RepID=UPI0036A565F4
MYASLMLASGSALVLLGVLALNGRGNAENTRSPVFGWGFIVMGGGFALDGGPTLLGLSIGARATLAGVALALVVLGGVLWLWGRTRARRVEKSQATSSADRFQKN